MYLTGKCRYLSYFWTSWRAPHMVLKRRPGAGKHRGGDPWFRATVEQTDLSRVYSTRPSHSLKSEATVSCIV